MNSASPIATASLHPQEAPTTLAQPNRPFFWSLRRELWENRWLHLAPLVAAMVAVLAFVLSLVHRAGQVGLLPALDPTQHHGAMNMPYYSAGGLIMVTSFIAGIFYTLDALYGERRDRSVLFWKSLPVSDTVAVLAKFVVPMIVIPVITFVLLTLTVLVMLPLSAAALRASGQSLALLWAQMPFERLLALLYHLATSHVLWYAPVYAWLLLVSAWARRAPFLWAFLPPFAIAVIEKVAFNTSYVAQYLEYRLATGPENSGVATRLSQLAPGEFFFTPGLWGGFVVAALLLFAAVRLRRYREPI